MLGTRRTYIYIRMAAPAVATNIRTNLDKYFSIER